MLAICAAIWEGLGSGRSVERLIRVYKYQQQTVKLLNNAVTQRANLLLLREGYCAAKTGEVRMEVVEVV